MGLRHCAVSPQAARHAADSISGGYSLQHEEGRKPDSWDLEVLVSQGGPGHGW
jgi:hypothetical protein